MEKEPEIVCAICRAAQPEFEAITRQINQAQTPAAKAPFARQLIEKVEAVSKEHDTSGRVLTEPCLDVLNLRKQVAELILKFQR